MKKKYAKSALALCIIIFGCSQYISSQVNDAQLWDNIGFEKNINPRLMYHVIQQGRIRENYTQPFFNDFDIGLNYKASKHIHMALAYVLAKKLQQGDLWSSRHQAYANVTFRKKLKGFLIGDRQMFLWQIHDYFSSAKGKNPDYYLRNKVTIKYERNFKFAPYVASEIYYHANALTDNWQFRFNRVRYFAGVFYQPDLTNEFEIYYLIEKHFNVKNPATNYIIGLGFTHVF